MPPVRAASRPVFLPGLPVAASSLACLGVASKAPTCSIGRTQHGGCLPAPTLWCPARAYGEVFPTSRVDWRTVGSLTTQERKLKVPMHAVKLPLVGYYVVVACIARSKKGRKKLPSMVEGTRASTCGRRKRNRIWTHLVCQARVARISFAFLYSTESAVLQGIDTFSRYALLHQ